MLRISQSSDDERLIELELEGPSLDLRALALGILDAVDRGEYTARVGDTKLVITCTDEEDE